MAPTMSCGWVANPCGATGRRFCVATCPDVCSRAPPQVVGRLGIGKCQVEVGASTHSSDHMPSAPGHLRETPRLTQSCRAPDVRLIPGRGDPVREEDMCATSHVASMILLLLRRVCRTIPWHATRTKCRNACGRLSRHLANTSSVEPWIASALLVEGNQGCTLCHGLGAARSAALVRLCLLATAIWRTRHRACCKPQHLSNKIADHAASGWQEESRPGRDSWSWQRRSSTYSGSPRKLG